MNTKFSASTSADSKWNQPVQNGFGRSRKSPNVSKKMSSFGDLMGCVLGYTNHDELNWAINELDNDIFYPKGDNHQDWKVIHGFYKKDDAFDRRSKLFG